MVYPEETSTPTSVVPIEDESMALFPVQKKLLEVYENAGLTKKGLATAVGRALRAKKVVHVFDKEDGHLDVITDHDDHAIQLKAVDQGRKMIQDVEDMGNDKKGGSQHLHIHVSKKEGEKMEKAVAGFLLSEYGKKS